MKTTQKRIRISEIVVGERSRKEFGGAGEVDERKGYKEVSMDELMESIRQTGGGVSGEGLILPIAVLRIEDGYQLLAGGRRVEACKKLGWIDIPANVFDGEMTESKRRVIELTENIIRKDLIWAEIANSRTEIDRLLKLEHGTRKPGPQPEGDESWSTRDTAKLTGVIPSTIHRDAKLIEGIATFPEVARCKTRATALAMLERIKNDTSYSVIHTGTPEDELLKTLLQTHYHDSSYEENLEEIRGFAANLVLVLKDISVEEMKEIHQVLAPNCFIIYFGASLEVLEQAGFTDCHELIWVWESRNFTAPAELQPNCRRIWYARKGACVLNKVGRSKVFNQKTITPALRSHPDELPIELYKLLIETFLEDETSDSSVKGRVFIPFAGEGNAMLAALVLKHTMLGYTDKVESAELREVYLEKVRNNKFRQYTSFPNTGLDGEES